MTETLEALFAAHRFDGGWCYCGDHLEAGHAAHLADVVRAWLAEQAGRPDLRLQMAREVLGGPDKPWMRADQAMDIRDDVMACFLAALDRRPDGASEVNGADLRAEQGQTAHGASDDAAGLSEAVSELRRRLDKLDRATIYGKPISAWLKEAR